MILPFIVQVQSLCVMLFDTARKFNQNIMTKFLTVIFVSLALVSCGQNINQNDKDKERIDKVCDTFMQTFVSGKLSEALQLLKQNTVMDTSSIDTLQVTIQQQMQDIFPQYGKMLSSEFVKEKKIKDFISKRFYVIKFSKFFLKVDFTLYKNQNGWTITTFHYNEDIDELLD